MVSDMTCNVGNITEGLCNTITGSSNLLTGKPEYDNYGYLLSAWSVYLFFAVFIVAFVAHVALGIWARTWWMIATMGSGTAVEILGWAGRLWSKTSTYWDPNSGGFWSLNYNGFIMQTVCLVAGPCFFSAANYILLGRLIRLTGPDYSILHPSPFAKVFTIADVTCLVIQAVGGGIAGSAETLKGSNNGGYIMTAGVVLQLVLTFVYLILLVELLYRVTHNIKPKRQFNPLPSLKCWGKRAARGTTTVTITKEKVPPSTSIDTERSAASNIDTERRGSDTDIVVNGERHVKFSLTICMICLTTLLIIVRSVYRSIELSRGWTGPIATSQPLFLGFDALLMSLVSWLYVIVHPSFLLDERRH